MDEVVSLGCRGRRLHNPPILRCACDQLGFRKRLRNRSPAVISRSVTVLLRQLVLTIPRVLRVETNCNARYSDGNVPRALTPATIHYLLLKWDWGFDQRGEGRTEHVAAEMASNDRPGKLHSINIPLISPSFRLLRRCSSAELRVQILGDEISVDSLDCPGHNYNITLMWT